MPSNLDRYKTDLESLISTGRLLDNAIKAECFPQEFDKQIKSKGVKNVLEYRKRLPTFKVDYQRWYSEARVVVRQLLPDRLADFVGHYDAPRGRKKISYENYRIQDYLQGLSVTVGWDQQKVVGPDAAVPQFEQQLAILEAAKARFESSLFDIRQLVQADLFDSDLDAAQELITSRFIRAAGAVAGVVLEKHLAQVCEDHSLKLVKKSPTIGDLSNYLKEAGVIDIPEWRFVQHLADIRNLCDHSKKVDPTLDQANELVAGVRKVIKTVF